MYKKIYLEITNNCNLKCSFCLPNSRLKKYLSISEYQIILNKIKDYTKYLYLHIAVNLYYILLLMNLLI